MSPSPGEPPADPVSEQQVTEAAAEPTAVNGVVPNAGAVESGQQPFNGCVCTHWMMTAVRLAVGHLTTLTQQLQQTVGNTAVINSLG